jgi:predicted site-specific integrase-resolvase
MLLTTKMMAKRLGISESQVRRLAKKGKVGYKVPSDGAWIFTEQDIAIFKRRPTTRGRKKLMP